MALVYRDHTFTNIRSGGGVETLIVNSIRDSVGVSTNTLVLAAVTGKKIRVVGIDLQSTTATQGVYSIMDGSSGTVKLSGTAPPVAGLPFLRPIVPCGYFESTISTGLYITVVTATVAYNLYYIIYTP